MKNQKKFVALILAVILLLAGCTITPVVTEPTTTEDSGTTQPNTSQDPTDSTPSVPDHTYPLVGIPTEPIELDPDNTVTCQYLPETVENPDDLPVLKWVCMPYERTHVWTEEAVHELNQMLADRNMPFRVQFIVLTAERVTEYDWFADPAVQTLLQEADLVHGLFSASSMREYLTPITEHVTGNAEPTLKNAVVHDLNWLSGSVDGEIYGIMSGRYPIARGSGWEVDSNFMKDHGLTEADFSRNFWEMDELFAEIYKKNGNQAFLFLRGDGLGTIAYVQKDLRTVLPRGIADIISQMYQGVGSCFVIDCSSGIPTVANLMETDTVRNVWDAVMRYKVAGYIVDEYSAPDAYYAAPVKYTAVEGDSTFIYESLYQGKLYNWAYIPVTDSIYPGSEIGGLLNGVCADSQHKEEAITLLNLIAEDEVFRNQLLFGKEGRDYVIKDGGYSLVRQDGGANYSMIFLSQHAYFEDAYGRLLSCPTGDGEARLQAYRDILDNATYSYYPIIFDYTGFEEELIAIAEISNEYYYDLTKFVNGEPVITEEVYDQMLQAFKDAGSEKIIAELQRQLDAWLAENPDWLARYD